MNLQYVFNCVPFSYRELIQDFYPLLELGLEYLLNT